jgi:putative ABC transport system permease protein
MIKIKNLNKSHYIDKNHVEHVLKNISLEIMQGEFVAITGQSGSGKSTLLNIIGGLDSKYEGMVTFKGNELDKLNLDLYHSQSIGFIFQSFHLIEHLSIIKNVTLAMGHSKRSQKQKNDSAQQLLKKVGLEGMEQKLPSQLSGGQKQRVAIARALANNPEVVIADEPTGALDTETSKEIIELLRSLNREGMTLIIVTHEMSVAEQANRVLKIEDGQIQNQSSAATLSEALTETISNKEVKKDRRIPIRDLATFAFGNFRERLVRNTLIGLAMSIGIIAILLAMGTGNGVEQRIDEIFSGRFSPNQITTFYKDPQARGVTRPTTALSSEEIRKIKEMYLEEGIEEVYEIKVVPGVTIKYVKNDGGTELLQEAATLQAANFANKRYQELSVEQETLLAGKPVLQGEKGILLTSSLAKQILETNFSENKDDYEQLIGQKIALHYFSRNTTDEVFIEAPIVGITNSNQEGFASNISVGEKTLAELQTAANLSDTIISIDGFATNTTQVEEIIEKYADKDSWSEYAVTNGNSFVDTFSQFTQIIVTLIAGIAGISLLVSGVMIAIVLYISVIERKREIGILRAIGYSKVSVSSLFILEAVFMILLANLFSIGLSWGISTLANPILENNIGFANPIMIMPIHWLMTVFITLIIGNLFAFYPSRKAAKLDPIQALQSI